MDYTYEIFYDPPKISSNFNEILTTYNLSQFYKIKPTFSNSLFRLSSAILKESKGKQQNVVLLEFFVFPCDLKSEAFIRSALVKSQGLVQEKPDFHYFYLKRIGYCMNKDNNTIMLVYLNNGNISLDLKKIYQEYENPKMVLLMYYNLLMEFYIKHYEQSCNFGILHPQLIFESKICGFQLIDYALADILKDYPINIDNFTIASFFGIYDPEVLEILNTEDGEIIRNSADVFLLSAFLAYLFSVDFNKDKIDTNSIKNNYNVLLFKLRSDFNCKSTKFKNFLDCIHDKEVRYFLSEILNLNYKDVASIHKFKQLFSKILLETNLSKVKCSIQTCRSKAERLNFICKHFLCSSCYKTHIDCSKFDPEKLVHDKNKYMFATDNLNRISTVKQLLYDLKHESFVKYFEENIKSVLLRIEDDQEKSVRYIKLIDSKLNDMIYYVERLIRLSFNPKFDHLKKLIKNVEAEITKFDIKFKKSLNNLNAQNPNATATNQGNNIKPTPRGMKLIDNPSALKILNKENKAKTTVDIKMKKSSKYEQFREKYEIFEDFFRSFCLFLEKIKTIKNNINHLINQQSPFLTLSNQESLYFEQLNVEFQKQFKKLAFRYEEELFKLHSKAELYESPENNILELNRITENKMLASLDWSKETLYVYSFKDNADAKLKLLYPQNENFEPKKILKHSKWLNLGGKLLITGGIYKKENREFCSKLAYYVNIYETSKVGMENERDVIRLSDMLYERDQHCLIHVNSFYIAAIGGSRYVECEMYNILKNEWKIMPELPEIIMNASAVLFNRTNIYLFFGARGNSGKTRDPEFQQDILKLKLFEYSSWEIISDDTSRYQVCNFSILNYNDTIYILGGKISYEFEEKKNNSKSILEYDPEKNKLELSKYLLPKPVCFFESNFISIASSEFALYSTDYHLVRLKL